MGYTVERDVEGDLRVAVPAGEGRFQTVGVGSHTQTLVGNLQFREIWAVAARIPGSLPDGLAEDLLGDSWSSRNLGAWALAGQTSDGKQVLVYLIRVDAAASKKLLQAALADAARSAAEL